MYSSIIKNDTFSSFGELLSGSWCVNSAFTGHNTLTTVCLPSCDYALDEELAFDPNTYIVEQFGLINSSIRACFWLHCKLFHAAPTLNQYPTIQ